MARDARGIDLAGVLEVLVTMTHKRREKEAPPLSGDDAEAILTAIGYEKHHPDYDRYYDTGGADLTEEERKLCAELDNYSLLSSFKGMVYSGGRRSTNTLSVIDNLPPAYSLAFANVLYGYRAGMKKLTNAEMGRLFAYLDHRKLLHPTMREARIMEAVAGILHGKRNRKWSGKQMRKSYNAVLHDAVALAKLEAKYNARVAPDAREALSRTARGEEVHVPLPFPVRDAINRSAKQLEDVLPVRDVINRVAKLIEDVPGLSLLPPR